jgi:hypothetical protein
MGIQQTNLFLQQLDPISDSVFGTRAGARYLQHDISSTLLEQLPFRTMTTFNTLPSDSQLAVLPSSTPAHLIKFAISSAEANQFQTFDTHLMATRWQLQRTTTTSTSISPV